jgi:hypothetical protein
MLKNEAAQAAPRMPNELRERANGFMRWMCGLKVDLIFKTVRVKRPE